MIIFQFYRALKLFSLLFADKTFKSNQQISISVTEWDDIPVEIKTFKNIFTNVVRIRRQCLKLIFTASIEVNDLKWLY